MIPIPLQPPIVSTIHAYVGQPPHAFFSFFSFTLLCFFVILVQDNGWQEITFERGERGKGQNRNGVAGHLLYPAIFIYS